MADEITMEEQPGVTRFEVVDSTAGERHRSLVRHQVRVTLSRQDDGRTLKVFLDADLEAPAPEDYERSWVGEARAVVDELSSAPRAGRRTPPAGLRPPARPPADDEG